MPEITNRESKFMCYNTLRLTAAIFLACLGLYTHSAVAQHSTTAYCWDKPNPSVDNLVPFCWVGTYVVPGKMYKISDLAGIAAHLQTMPEGKRCIFLWDQHREMVNYPADYLRDSLTGAVQGFTDTLGVFHPFPTLWWEGGAAYVAQLHENLFAGLDSLNAPLDMVVLDFEQGTSNWTLSRATNNFAVRPEDKDSIITDLYEAIMADERAPALTAELGFDDLLNVKNWFNNGYYYLIFNDFWWRKRSEYLQTAIITPLHAHYPMACISNYGDAHVSAEYPVPESNGHRIYCCGNTGTHSGTHQSDSYYGYLGQVCTFRLPEGVTSFPKTPFNALIYSANKMKGARLSHPAPLIGWVAYPSFQENNSVLYADSPYFYENLFHLLLSGSDDVLYWNPKPLSGPTELFQQEATQMGIALLEFDAFWHAAAPNSTRFYPADTITPWNTPYVLTGMESDSIVLWRFSPRLDTLFDEPSDFLVAGADSLTFDVHGAVLTFPQEAFIAPDNALSAAGLWIVLPKKQVATGVTPITPHASVRIFPNPTADQFDIQSDLRWDRAVLRNALGQYVREFGFGDNLSLAGLPDGVYTLEVFTTLIAKPEVFKVVKK